MLGNTRDTLLISLAKHLQENYELGLIYKFRKKYFGPPCILPFRGMSKQAFQLRRNHRNRNALKDSCLKHGVLHEGLF